jgi:hypothetical protein
LPCHRFDAIGLNNGNALRIELKQNLGERFRQRLLYVILRPQRVADLCPDFAVIEAVSVLHSSTSWSPSRLSAKMIDKGQPVLAWLSPITEPRGVNAPSRLGCWNYHQIPRGMAALHHYEPNERTSWTKKDSGC